MNNVNLIIIVITCISTSIVWLIYVQLVKNKLERITNNHNNLNKNIDNEIIVRGSQNVEELKDVIIMLKSEISDTKHKSFFEGYQKAKDEFYLNITPYSEENKKGNTGVIVNDFHHKVYIGYKYQLYINGLPILEPTIRWEKIIEEKKREVDQAKIRSALEMIEKNLLPIVAQSNKILRYIPII